MQTLFEHVGLTADTLYLCGGTYSPDRGCPAWGTSYSHEMVSIGDKVGEIQISYADGHQEQIPLIFGFTLWFTTPWQEGDAPFSTDPASKQLLDRTLFLGRIWEKDGNYLLKYRLNGRVSKIAILSSAVKDGFPIFRGVALLSHGEKIYSSGFDTQLLPKENDPFYIQHTLQADTPIPSADLEEIRHKLYLFPEDYQYTPSGDTHTYHGSIAANLLDRQQEENFKDLKSRIDSDGFLHTSYKGAPNWNYFGFGTYHPARSAYYDKLYSRDAGRTLMTLIDFGELKTVERAINVFHKCLMFFPEHQLTINGEKIPGHWTVMPNEPLIYSTYLVPECNWPTQYTKERFGEGYQNLGNLEPDGHGLMMLAVWKFWQACENPDDWAAAQFQYIKEAAEFVIWALEHPEVTLSKKGLLYGETEAAMNDYTIYANLPNMLGLLKYAQIAQSIGELQYSERWRCCAEQLKNAIVLGFADTSRDVWKNFGFYHDPIPFMYYDISSPLLEDMPASWRTRSEKTYLVERCEMEKRCWFGSHATGYDHCNITQNALLLDQMADAEKLVKNLSRFSYAPHLPEPFLVPESFSYDSDHDMLRRQGDLGNLVQQAEMLKVTQIITGIKLCGKTLYIVPRIFPNWELQTEILKTAYPCNGIQTAHLLIPAGTEKTVFRAGPFSKTTGQLYASCNGSPIEMQTIQSGDSVWGTTVLTGSGCFELQITEKRM